MKVQWLLHGARVKLIMFELHNDYVFTVCNRSMGCGLKKKIFFGGGAVLWVLKAKGATCINLKNADVDILNCTIINHISKNAHVCTTTTSHFKILDPPLFNAFNTEIETISNPV